MWLCHYQASARKCTRCVNFGPVKYGATLRGEMRHSPFTWLFQWRIGRFIKLSKSASARPCLNILQQTLSRRVALSIAQPPHSLRASSQSLLLNHLIPYSFLLIRNTELVSYVSSQNVSRRSRKFPILSMNCSSFRAAQLLDQARLLDQPVMLPLDKEVS